MLPKKGILKAYLLSRLKFFFNFPYNANLYIKKPKKKIKTKIIIEKKIFFLTFFLLCCCLIYGLDSAVKVSMFKIKVFNNTCVLSLSKKKQKIKLEKASKL